ncbi:MAG: CBS domain-containing protein [Actinomycetota bacterium]
MEEDYVSVSPLAGLEEVATIMLERDVDYVLVVENDNLLGVITRGTSYA